jgi:hypothetical protein
MKAGTIAIANGAGPLDDSAFPYTRTEEGLELQSTLELEGQLQALDEFEVTTGTAAQETPNNHTTYEIAPDGSVEAEEDTTEKQTEASNIVYVEGEFLVTESNDCEYARDLADASVEHGTVEPATIDLDSFLRSVSDFDPWMAGFCDRDAPVDSGHAFGDYDADEDIRNVIAESELNQIGLKNFNYRGRQLKFQVTRSGYVEVYQPSDMETLEFTRFLQDHILPHMQVE